MEYPGPKLEVTKPSGMGLNTDVKDIILRNLSHELRKKRLPVVKTRKNFFGPSLKE